MVGTIGTANLFEGAEAEDARDQWPEMWNVGDDDCGRRFACVPIQVDQRAIGSGEVCDSIEDGAEDLSCISIRQEYVVYVDIAYH